MQRLKWIGKLLVAGILATILAGGFGVGLAAAASRQNSDVGVGIQASAASVDGTLNYTVTVASTGETMVKHVTVTVPFDAAALQPVSGTLQSDTGWVRIGSSAVTIQTGALGSNGDSVQATLSFRTLPGHPGARLTERASFSWRAADEHGSGVSNLPVADQASIAVQAEGRDLVFNSSVFGSNEGITFWYNAPNGRVVATRIRDGYLLDADVVAAKKAANNRKAHHGTYKDGADHLFADSQGAVSVRLKTAGLAPGFYTLVARGNASGLIAVGSFEVK